MQPNENEQFNNTNEQFENANSSPQQNENMNDQFILSDKNISRSEYATDVLEEKQINTPYFTANFHTPGYLEHKEIKRRGNILGFAFCLTNVTNLFLLV